VDEKMADGKIVRVNGESFEKEVLHSELPVMADFYADWCGPCRMVAPIMEKLSKEYDGKVKFVKINTDENQELAMKYDIMSIPTLMVFKNGQIVQRFIGAAPEQYYRRLIEPVLRN
jgi:thioredoxin 1